PCEDQRLQVDGISSHSGASFQLCECHFGQHSRRPVHASYLPTRSDQDDIAGGRRLSATITSAAASARVHGGGSDLPGVISSTATLRR
ncbi:hypothetical protein FOZ63_028229, partial [Perkinsus olseni]